MLIPLVVSAALLVNAQKLNMASVPTNVQEAFAKKHQGLKVKWEMEKALYEANFKQDGIAISELYRSDGTMTESETAIKTSELPFLVRDYLRSHYNGSAIKDAARIMKADGTVNFEAGVRHVDVVFDATGKFVKEVRD